MDRATSAVLARLRRGPASTVELQAELYATHVPKQIFDLRQADYDIATIRLRNGTALYQLVSEPGWVPPALSLSERDLATLVSEPGAPVGAGPNAVARAAAVGDKSMPNTHPAPSRAPAQLGDDTVVAGSHSYHEHPPRPQFGDPALLREMRSKGRR